MKPPGKSRSARLLAVLFVLAAVFGAAPAALAETSGVQTIFETYTSSTPYFPVYQSTNVGGSWSYLSQIDDTVNGYGMRWNPVIYELPATVGSLPAGTLLVSGLSVPSSLASTSILLFDSTNQGKSWSYLSTVAVGGEAIASEPYTPVWTGRSWSATAARPRSP